MKTLKNPIIFLILAVFIYGCGGGGGGSGTPTTDTTTLTTTTTSDTTTSSSPSLAEAVDNTSLSWTTGGDANWAGQTTVSYFGGSAAQSGAIGDSKTTYIQTTVTGSGTLTFYWKISSESYYDYLIFYIDGVEQSGKISGNVDWVQKSYSITSGNHTLKWAYTKDYITSSGSDAGWLDKVVFTQSTSTTTTTTTTDTTSARVTDIDGNAYNTVTIGTQVWMKENLKVTKYRNGDAIPTTITSINISSETSPKYQWAYGNQSLTATFGRLYTWYAATDDRGLCPTGWHLPTHAEWTTLIDYLGGKSVAGGKMKHAGTTLWASPNTGADNSSGFTALPGGYRDSSGQFNTYGYYGWWWSATEYIYNPDYAWHLYLWSESSYANLSGYSPGGYYYSKRFAFSVRCIRD